MPTELIVAGLAIALTTVAVVLLLRGVRSRRMFGTPEDRATYRILHFTGLASPALRSGLHAGADRAAKHLHHLLGTEALALVDGESTLAWEGPGQAAHEAAAAGHAAAAITRDSTEVLEQRSIECSDPDCMVRHAVAAPLTTDEHVVGALVAYTSQRPTAGLIRAVEEVARFVSGQLELAELDRSRSALAEAELRALRAQISPHFIYNSLGAIASYVRTDPEHARELLLDFADFTRYSFRRHGEFTTLAEELRSIERYLALEKARFGERLRVTLRISPEVLPVALPFLSLQPLVENAVQHGLESQPEGGHVTIVAEDAGTEAVISIEDDGVGMDPADLRRTLAGDNRSDQVGIANVDDRLRTTFGEEFGLAVETAVGAGAKVILRIPKYHPDVRADS